MAHKVLVSGTVYEMDGGKDLIGGTVYEKDHGKTLVGGTAYEVGFAPPAATVTITSTGYDANVGVVSVTIDGTKYMSAATIVVPIGTIIRCFIDDSHPYRTSSIDLVKDGTTTTLVTASGNTATYDYTVTGNVSVAMDKENGSYGRYAKITITEQ